MYKKYFYSFFFGFFFSISINAIDFKINSDYTFNIKKVNQDKTILIKKIKAKINALEKRRIKLKGLKKWPDAREKTHISKIEKLRYNLIELGDTATRKLDVDEIIRKLQKQLKYINNARVNKNAKDSFTKKDDSIYKKKASILIDSIIKLRMRKV